MPLRDTEWPRLILERITALESEIARLKTPEYVLGEAERLLRSKGSPDHMLEVTLFTDGDTQIEVTFVGDSGASIGASYLQPSFALAYAKLREVK